MRGRIARAGIRCPLALAIVAALGLAQAPDRASAFPVSGATIWTIGGSDGPPLQLGDGGPAIDAALAKPWGIAVDRAGNIYVADTGSLPPTMPAGWRGPGCA